MVFFFLIILFIKKIAPNLKSFEFPICWFPNNWHFCTSEKKKPNHIDDTSESEFQKNERNKFLLNYSARREKKTTKRAKKNWFPCYEIYELFRFSLQHLNQAACLFIHISAINVFFNGWVVFFFLSQKVPSAFDSWIERCRMTLWCRYVYFSFRLLTLNVQCDTLTFGII